LMLPWRLADTGPLRWAVRRILADGRFSKRSAQIADWAKAHDGSEQGAALVGRLAD
jgi:hypothetical protein